MEPLRVCFATSEVVPYVKTGGLADVSAALPRFLHADGHDVRVFAPLYSQVDSQGSDITRHREMENLKVDIGGKSYTFSVYEARLGKDGHSVYFVDCPVLFHRDSIYTNDDDEHRRFILLSRAVLEACQRLQWAPDIFHVNDWQTSLLPLYLQTLYAWDQLFANSKTILTLHNVGYQGVFGREAIADAGLGDDEHLFHSDDLARGFVSFLRTGLLYADHLTTVSPTYAAEIQTEAYGMGLQDLLASRAKSLTGILNGVDYDEWSPENDRYLVRPYTAETIDLKDENRDYLLDTIGLDHRGRVPIVGVVSRLASQKGLNLVLEVLPFFLRRGALRLVVLGTGESRFEQGFLELQQRFPGDVCFYHGFHEELAHLIEGGSDMFLMPSRYEPCGLNQMYSLRYGTVPLVRNTGGLADAVQQYDPRNNQGTGFLFDHYATSGLRWAIGCALEVHEDAAAWRHLMLNGMEKDFSWETQGPKYVELYRRLLAS